MPFDELHEHRLLALSKRGKDRKTIHFGIFLGNDAPRWSVSRLRSQPSPQENRDRAEELIERFTPVDECRASGTLQRLRPVAVVNRIDDAHLDVGSMETADQSGARARIEQAGIDYGEVRPPVDSVCC